MNTTIYKIFQYKQATKQCFESEPEMDIVRG